MGPPEADVVSMSVLNPFCALAPRFPASILTLGKAERRGVPLSQKPSIVDNIAPLQFARPLANLFFWICKAASEKKCKAARRNPEKPGKNRKQKCKLCGRVVVFARPPG